MTACRFAVYAFVCANMLGIAVFAQEFRGAISGVITDPTSAAVAGAKVTITSEQTGTKFEATSEPGGQYGATALLPGDYDIQVHAPGFKAAVRKGIHIGAGDHPIIDIRLDVGEAVETVEVTASAPLLNSESATVGQAITTKEVEDLPLNGRTPLVLASLAMGVVATGQPSLIHPFDSGGAAGWSIAGSPSQTNEILIDGSPDATWDGRLAYSPPTDAVQEVRVKAFDTDAAFGHTSGGTLNQVLKSGTNSLHGSLWEFNQPNNLTANNFFNNKNGLGNPVTHYNQYGVTAGGPVVIPKIVNGKNKLFWFFAWEGLKDSQPNTTFLSVPTDAERQGDFSALLKLGPQYQLYDPSTAVQNGTVVTRKPFAGNIIPQGQLNPIALNILKLFPEPNIAGQPGGFDNYGNTAPTTDNYNNYLGRLDYNMSQRNQMFFDIRTTDYLQVKNNYFGNFSTGSLLTRNNIGGSLDDVFTVNPTNVVDVRLNFTRMDESHPSPSAGFNPTTLGLPSYLAANSQYLQLPYITFANNTDTPALGTNGANILPSQSVQLFGSWVTIHGSHTIKFGGDVRQYVLNATSFGNSVGNFAFTANSWVRSASNASSTVVQGQDLAEFLLGLPTGGSYDINASGSWYEHYFAGFVQDDWRVTRTLTLNVGLRFDRDQPYHEKYDRTVNGFDTTTPNPLAPAAMAAYTSAYAKNPIPQLPPDAFHVLGGLTYPSDGAVYGQSSHLFSPRAGFAWTPDLLHGKTVFRGGFGMFAQPVGITQLAISGKYSTNPILDQEGFSQSTSLTPSEGSFVTPVGTLSNPFPGGIKQPQGSAAGLGTYAGQTVQFIGPEKDPYGMRWNFGIEQQIAKDTVLEVAYVGNHGVHLPVFTTSLNGIPRQYLSTMGTRDQPVIDFLTATYPNPFKGLATAQNGSNTTVAQLLAPFPQFPVGYSGGTWSGSTGVIEYNNPVGSSYYESLNIRLQRRFSSGLTLVGNYIRSKLIERDTWLNDTDPQPEKRISPFDAPNRFVTAVTYDLPFGRGRRFNLQSRWADAIAGGWGINSIYTYQTGAPITWVNGSTTSPGDYVYFGGPLALNNRETNTKAFNTSAFDTKSADQLQYHIRTFSTTFPNLRQDGINEWEASVTKRFEITEKTYFQIRAEAYNALNHPTFAAPNTTATNSGFGLITSQANRPRTLQFGARLVF